ncbi:MAG: hypothetical protein ACLFU8_06845 [Anaerolineales bacterium]
MQLRLFTVPILALLLLTAGCALPTLSRRELTPSPTTATEVQGSIEIRGVRVDLNSGDFTFNGRTTLPEETCIQTTLLGDDVPLPWWPTERCAERQEDGTWAFSASAPAPEVLDATGTPEVMYELWAEAPALPQVEPAVFQFDFYGPPAPPEP